MSNLLSWRSEEVKTLLRLSKAEAVMLFLSLLAAAILIPAQPAFPDDDDILLYIPAIIAGSAGWRNTTLSHPVPLT